MNLLRSSIDIEPGLVAFGHRRRVVSGVGGSTGSLTFPTCQHCPENILRIRFSTSYRYQLGAAQDVRHVLPSFSKRYRAPTHRRCPRLECCIPVLATRVVVFKVIIDIAAEESLAAPQC